MLEGKLLLRIGRMQKEAEHFARSQAARLVSKVTPPAEPGHRQMSNVQRSVSENGVPSLAGGFEVGRLRLSTRGRCREAMRVSRDTAITENTRLGPREALETASNYRFFPVNPP